MKSAQMGAVVMTVSWVAPSTSSSVRFPHFHPLPAGPPVDDCHVRFGYVGRALLDGAVGDAPAVRPAT